MLDAVLAWSPAQPVFRAINAARLAVLAYHHVPDRERFSQHLDLLAEETSPVTLEQAIAGLIGRRSLPRHPLLITFDDGDRSVFDVAKPLLEERGLPAVAFVVAGQVGTQTPSWWEEVRDLVAAGGSARGLEATIATGEPRAPEIALKKLPDARRLAMLDELRASASRPSAARPQLTADELRTLESSGIAIGNHSMTHPRLALCDDAKIEREIVDAHAFFTDALGHAPAAFAYPDGSVDGRARDVVAATGYEVAFIFDHRLASTPSADPLMVSRLRVSADAGLDRLRIIVSGLHSAILGMRGRI